MGLQLPHSWSRSFLPLLTTCSVYFLLCQFVTTVQAFEPPQTLPYSVLEYPNNGTVMEQPPPAAVAVSTGNGTSSRADRRKHTFFSAIPQLWQIICLEERCFLHLTIDSGVISLQAFIEMII